MSSVRSPAESAARPLGRLTVLGLGLMGGSLARGVSSLELADRVTGWSPRSTERDAALTAGAVSLAAADWREAVAEADVVVLAVPLGPAVDLLKELGDAAPERATLTDVVSLKAPLEEVAREAGVAARWVGSHPMTGGASSGFWASRADLFEGARVWTVPGDASPEHRRRVEHLWKGLGAETRLIAAAEHDRLMALASHLPQLVSNALAGVLDENEVGAGVLGPGGRDMTRLAASSPDVWLDLLARSSPDLVAGLRAVSRELGRAADLVESLDLAGLEALMRRTRKWSEER